MRIYLLTGGLVLLAAVPLAAQEATDSTRVFAVPASTPASPNVQELFIGAAAGVGTSTSGSALGLAGAALAGLGLSLFGRGAGRGGMGALRGA
jgi:hypothetical protein